MFHPGVDYIELGLNDHGIDFRLQRENIFCFIDGTWLRCWWLDIIPGDGEYLRSMRATHAPKNWVEGKGHKVAEKVKIDVESVQVHSLDDSSHIYVRTWAGLLYCCDFENEESHVNEAAQVAGAIRTIGYIELPGDWKPIG